MITGHSIIEYAGKIAARDAASEVGQRAAISRAYYGAFHLVKSFLRDLGIPTTSKHNVQTYLQACSLIPAKRAGNKLADLQSERIKADYDLQEFAPPGREPQKFVQYCVELAKDIESLIGQCDNQAARDTVKTEVELLLTRQRRTSRTHGSQNDPTPN